MKTNAGVVGPVAAQTSLLLGYMLVIDLENFLFFDVSPFARKWPISLYSFIGRLSRQISERDIEEAFGKYGRVREVDVSTKVLKLCLNKHVKTRQVSGSPFINQSSVINVAIRTY